MALIQQILNALFHVQPPHPLFVHFPIALISVALFFILVAVWKKSDFFESAAFANLSLASISIIVAGTFGIWDNIVRFNNAAPNYLVKIVNACVLLVLTGSTALLRWRNPKLFHSSYRGWYIAVHVVSFILVAVQGFLGGIIVYGI
jgi:uncharacterized membrane protein